MYEVVQYKQKKYTINEKKRKTDDSVKNIEKPKIDNVNNNVSTYENHRHVVIGPSNVGKTYYMLKILEKKKITKDQFI